MDYQEAMDKALWAAEHEKDPAPWLAIAAEIRQAERTTSDASPIWTAQERARTAAAEVELGKLRTRYAALISDLEGIVATEDGMIQERHLDNVIRLFKDGS